MVIPKTLLQCEGFLHICERVFIFKTGIKFVYRKVWSIDKRTSRTKYSKKYRRYKKTGKAEKSFSEKIVKI